MKGLSIKKVAALGIGAALIGMSLAPVVSAANVTPNGLDSLTVDKDKSVVVDSMGVPVVDVVVGSNAAVSDVVWAGNVAAKVAQLATKAASGVGGVADATVDVTVGGTTSTTGSGNTDENVMEFVNGYDEFTLMKADYSDSSQFANIAGRTIRNAATESQINIDENLEVTADVEFQSVADGIFPGETVAKIQTNGLSYSLNLGTGIPYYTSLTQLDANAEYNVKVPILGKEYVVDEATSTKLVLYADTTPTELEVGESVDVAGVGAYEGKTLTVKLVDLVQIGSGNTTYQPKWTLFDGETALKTIQAATPYDLKDQFGSTYFTESVYVSAAGLNLANDTYTATVRTGTERLEIRNGQVFPYDSTNTTNPEWKATINSTATALNGSNGVITSVQIKNSWAYIQTKTEQPNSKLALGVGQTVELPEGYGKFQYLGPQTKNMAKVTVGGDSVLITDTKGIQRDIPLVISLGTGTNTFSVAGSTYTVDVNTAEDKIRFWTKPTSNVAQPYINPIGDQNTEWFDVAYTDKDVNTDVGAAVGLTVDNDWLTNSAAIMTNSTSTVGKVVYYFGGDEATGQFWLFLAKQRFDVDSKADTVSGATGELMFAGTEVDQNRLNGVPSYGSVRVDLNYYLPDQSTYNVLTSEITEDTNVPMGTSPDLSDVSKVTAGSFRSPDSGDVYQYVATWVFNEGSAWAAGVSPTTTDINFYQNTENALLKDSTDQKNEYEGATVEVRHASWTLDEYAASASSKLTKGITVYGTTVDVADGVATIMLPEETRKVEAYLGSSDTVTTVVGGEQLTGIAVGGSDTTTAGTTVTVDAVNGTASGGVEVVSVGTLVKTDADFSNGKSIIIGGWVANNAAKNLEVSAGNTLEDMLVSDGDYVAAVLTSGDIVAAGKTAADTGAAASALINALEGLM